MKGISLNDFCDRLYYGCDVEMKDDTWYYMIYSARLDNGKHSIRLWKFDKLDDTSEYSVELYNKEDVVPEKSVSAFLESPLFDGKSLYEIAQDVEILTIF